MSLWLHVNVRKGSLHRQESGVAGEAIPATLSGHSTLGSMCCDMPLSLVRLCVTPQSVARQAPLSMGFSRQDYRSGLLCHPPGGLPNPAIKPRSPTSQTDSLPPEPPGKRPCVL